jgi:hypothetical protein
MEIELVIERANQLIESRVEYETTHKDAGNNYAHMASEGDFDYHNGENRLAEYCAEMGIDITGLDMGRLAEDVIFWGYMTLGQHFDPKKRFLVSSFQVGEIETEVSAEDLGLDRISSEVIAELNRQCDAYFTPGARSLGTECDYCYAYVQTDSYWDMVCNLDVIKDLVLEMQEDN